MSLNPNKNGKLLAKEKGGLVINVCNLIIKSEDFPSWKDNAEDVDHDEEQAEIKESNANILAPNAHRVPAGGTFADQAPHGGMGNCVFSEIVQKELG